MLVCLEYLSWSIYSIIDILNIIYKKYNFENQIGSNLYKVIYLLQNEEHVTCKTDEQ